MTGVPTGANSYSALASAWAWRMHPSDSGVPSSDSVWTSSPRVNRHGDVVEPDVGVDAAVEAHHVLHRGPARPADRFRRRGEHLVAARVQLVVQAAGHHVGPGDRAVRLHEPHLLAGQVVDDPLARAAVGRQRVHRRGFLVRPGNQRGLHRRLRTGTVVRPRDGCVLRPRQRRPLGCGFDQRRHCRELVGRRLVVIEPLRKRQLVRGRQARHGEQRGGRRRGEPANPRPAPRLQPSRPARGAVPSGHAHPFRLSVPGR